MLALAFMMCIWLGCDAKRITDDPQIDGQGGIPQGSLADGDEVRGKALYLKHCSGCHGVEGRGDGPGAATINPKPNDHTNTQYMSSLSDQHLFSVVRRGGIEVGRKAMPPFPHLSDAEIKDLIAYMRSISK